MVVNCPMGRSHSRLIGDTMRLLAGGLRMAGYRLYFMDLFSGHIEYRREFLADDDAEAITIATAWDAGQPMELWLGTRKLKRWETEALAPD